MAIVEAVNAQPSVPERPLICWRTVSSEILDTGRQARRSARRSEDRIGQLELSIAAGQSGWLAWGARGSADGTGVFSDFQVRGDEPHVFLRGAAEDRVIWINATAPGDGVARMTIRTRRAGTGSCPPVGTGFADFLEIEAFGVNGASSCLGWPLPTAPQADPLDLEAVFAEVSGVRCFLSGVPVPRLVDRPLLEAERLISEASLELGRVETRPSRRRANVVLEQSPTQEETVPAGTPVDLVVAGERFTDTPNLEDETVERAGQILASVELQLQARSGDRAPDPEAIAGYRVADQTPEAGVPVPVGSAVEVQALVAVPSFVEMPLEEALKLSEDWGLSVNWPARGGAGFAGSAAGSVPAGIFAVDRQDPQPPALMAFGDVIELELVVEVPELRELSVAEASSRARVYGLRPDRNFERTLRENPRGLPTSVVSQRPLPKSRASPGDLVGVDVAVPMPELLDRSVASALERLDALGLTRGLALEPGSESLEAWRQRDAVHRIGSQQPEPGSWIVPGDPVAIGIEVRVPPLVRKTLTSAQAALNGTALRFVEAPSPPAPDLLGKVVWQRPPANTWAPAGSAVAVTLGGSLPTIDPCLLCWFWVILTVALAGGWWWVKTPWGKPPMGLEVRAVPGHGAQSFERSPGESAGLNVNVSLRVHADAGEQSLAGDG